MSRRESQVNASRKQSMMPDGSSPLATQSKKKEEEVIERILKAADPNLMSAPVYFDYKKDARTFKLLPSVSQCVTHFSLDSVSIPKNSPEALQEAEDRERRAAEVEAAARAELDPSLVDEGVPTKILKNQFNYSDRGSQTMNNELKEKSVLTDPPPSMNFGAMATSWAIYDAYEEDRIHNEKRAAAQKKSGGTRKEEEQGFTTGAGEIRNEQSAGPKTAQDILTSSNLRSSLKIMERMVNQNDCFDIIDDFRFWEDQSDLYKEEGTLLPLWQFYTDKTRKRAVTSIALNKRYNDFFAVGYGSYEFQKPVKGSINCFSLKNAVPTVQGGSLPANPEFSLHTDSGVLCLAFHPIESSLLACGLYDGAICVFDLRVKDEKQRTRPIYYTTVRNGKHTDAVWEIYWKNSATDLSFYSISTDGRITNWILNTSKKELISKDVMTLDNGAIASDPETIALSRLGGMCMDYSPEHDKVVVGTQEGAVLLCTTAYNGQCVERYEGHSMGVYTARWNPFHPDVFLTCSADWTVKLWLKSSTLPLLTFDLGDGVGDVAWSPYSATVFAAVTANGKVCVFDLQKNKTEPLCAQTVVKNAKLTHVMFSPVDPILYVGDTRGTVLTVKLSPNLRKVAKPGKGEPDDADSLRKLEKDKLVRLIDITMKDRALLGTA